MSMARMYEGQPRQAPWRSILGEPDAEIASLYDPAALAPDRPFVHVQGYI
jgi:hypothetical protein